VQPPLLASNVLCPGEHERVPVAHAVTRGVSLEARLRRAAAGQRAAGELDGRVVC
jgi:hypothetical protein